MSASGFAVLAVASLAAGFIVGRAISRLLQRRDHRRELADVERRLEAIASLPAPDELPRARDLTKADRRRMTIDTTPRAHKRRDGRWG